MARDPRTSLDSHVEGEEPRLSSCDRANGWPATPLSRRRLPGCSRATGSASNGRVRREPDMTRLDITKTNEAVQGLAGATTQPPHRVPRPPYDRHRNLEMAGRYPEIFVPEMTVEHPVYCFNTIGMETILDGRDAVEAVYREWTETAQCVFYTEDEKLAVGDDMICSTSTIFQQTPGGLLAAAGLDVDPEATYLMANRQHMIWPYDAAGRLVGEDVWEPDPSTRQLIRLEPDEVLTAQQAGEQLAPLIRPLLSPAGATH